jgi:hypothetical protein
MVPLMKVTFLMVKSTASAERKAWLQQIYIYGTTSGLNEYIIVADNEETGIDVDAMDLDETPAAAAAAHDEAGNSKGSGLHKVQLAMDWHPPEDNAESDDEDLTGVLYVEARCFIKETYHSSGVLEWPCVVERISDSGAMAAVKFFNPLPFLRESIVPMTDMTMLCEGSDLRRASSAVIQEVLNEYKDNPLYRDLQKGCVDLLAGRAKAQHNRLNDADKALVEQLQTELNYTSVIFDDDSSGSNKTFNDKAKDPVSNMVYKAASNQLWPMISNITYG